MFYNKVYGTVWSMMKLVSIIRKGDMRARMKQTLKSTEGMNIWIMPALYSICSSAYKWDLIKKVWVPFSTQENCCSSLCPEERGGQRSGYSMGQSILLANGLIFGNSLLRLLCFEDFARF